MKRKFQFLENKAKRQKSIPSEQSNIKDIISYLERHGAHHEAKIVEKTSLNFPLPVSNDGSENSEKFIFQFLSLENLKSLGDGSTLLHKAAADGFNEIVKYLLNNGAKHDIKNIFGQLPVHLAAVNGHVEVIRSLKKDYSELKDYKGNNVIHYAIKSKKINLINYVLEEGEFEDCLDAQNRDGYDPLHFAVLTGDLEIVKQVITAGYQLNGQRDRHGNKPIDLAVKKGYFDIFEFLYTARLERYDSPPPNIFLHYAIKNGNLEFVKRLVESSKIDSFNSHDESPLMLAIKKGYIEIAEFLIPKGADIHKGKILESAIEGGDLKYFKKLAFQMNLLKYEEKEFIPLLTSVIKNQNLKFLQFFENHGLIENASKINKIDIKQVLFHIAIETLIYTDNSNFKPDWEIIFYLLKNGALLDGQDSNGETAIFKMLSYSFSKSAQNLSFFNFLIKKGYKIENLKEKNDLLVVAVKLGNVELMEYFVPKFYPPNISVKFSHGVDKLIHIAAKNGREEICNLLFKYNIAIDIESNNGITPLYYAAEYGHKKVIDFLLDKGANYKRSFGEQKMTLMHAAASSGNKEIIKQFIKLGLDINAKALNDITPLHVSALKKNYSILKILLKKGADINILYKPNDLSISVLDIVFDQVETLLKLAPPVIRQMLFWTEKYKIVPFLLKYSSDNKNLTSSIPEVKPLIEILKKLDKFIQRDFFGDKILNNDQYRDVFFEFIKEVFKYKISSPQNNIELKNYNIDYFKLNLPEQLAIELYRILPDLIVEKDINSILNFNNLAKNMIANNYNNKEILEKAAILFKQKLIKKGIKNNVYEGFEGYFNKFSSFIPYALREKLGQVLKETNESLSSKLEIMDMHIFKLFDKIDVTPFSLTLSAFLKYKMVGNSLDEVQRTFWTDTKNETYRTVGNKFKEILNSEFNSQDFIKMINCLFLEKGDFIEMQIVQHITQILYELNNKFILPEDFKKLIGNVYNKIHLEKFYQAEIKLTAMEKEQMQKEIAIALEKEKWEIELNNAFSEENTEGLGVNNAFFD